MSHYSTLRGAISIEPPLNWAEIRASKWHRPDFRVKSDDGYDYVPFRLAVTATSRETDEGSLTEKTCAELYVDSEPINHCAMQATADFASSLIRDHPGHQFTGIIYGRNENPESIWRVHIMGRTVASLVPEIEWQTADVWKEGA